MIVKKRIEGLSFFEIEPKNVRAEVDQIMLRGAAVCGCHLPTTEFFAEIIAEETVDFITNFGYSELTMSEIFFALKLNARGEVKLPSGITLLQVSFNGFCFNVDYLAKILSNYMVLRRHLDRKLQNKIDGFE